MFIMIIGKILNNNVVVTTNEKQEEQIVMGRGLAYQKKVGEAVDESKIDKIFILNDSASSTKLQELMVHIPMEYLQVGEEIVTFIKLRMGKKLNDLLYISLVDHIYSAITRSKEGIDVKNFLLWDIKRFYKSEYEMGLETLNIIEKNFGVRLKNDEAGFIALHIVNAELEDDSVEDVYEITRIMQEITTIVKYEFKLEFDEDSVYYYRFITHLKFFGQRLVSGNTYKNDDGDELLEIVKSKYQNSFSCVQKITEFILKKYNYDLSDEEKVYLTIHIERVVYKK